MYLLFGVPLPSAVGPSRTQRVLSASLGSWSRARDGGGGGGDLNACFFMPRSVLELFLTNKRMTEKKRAKQYDKVGYLRYLESSRFKH